MSTTFQKLTKADSNTSNVYFVYVYIYPTSHVPFYVGYGKNDRHLYHIKEAIRKPTPKQGEHKLNIIRKILKANLEPIIKIVDNNLSREEARELEVFLISEIGRSDLNLGPLTNLTNGGDGNVNWTPVLRNAASIRQRGMIAAKDLASGKFLRVHKTDPRWINGELVGQNLGTVNSNKNGNLSGYILSKNPITGEILRVHNSDPRWINGELAGFNQGVACHENTRNAASKTHKGKPKTKEHNKKNSDANKLLKWYYNSATNKVGRYREGLQPDGFVRVSGPHKKTPI